MNRGLSLDIISNLKVTVPFDGEYCADSSVGERSVGDYPTVYD